MGIELEAAREWLTELHLQLVESTAQARSASGSGMEVLAQLWQLELQHPYRETLARALATVLIEHGNPAEAQRIVENFERRVFADLNLPASDDLVAFKESLRYRAKERATTAGGPGPSATTLPSLPPRDLDLVGRAAPLEMLRDRWRAAATSSQAGVTVVSGRAGVGKSRLLAEPAHEVGSDGAPVIWGGCQPTFRNPLGLIAGALRSFAHNDPDRAEIVLAAFGTHERFLLGFEHTMFHSASSPHDDHGLRLAELVIDGLAALGGREPVLIVLEDIHWAEDADASLLAAMIRSGRLQHTLVVVSHRVEPLHATRAGADLIGTFDRNTRTVRIPVTPLDSSAVRKLATVVTGGGVSERVIADLVGMSGGNALLATEAIIQLRDTGSVQGASRRVVQLVRDSLALLDGPARSTCELAAVIGARFDYRTLAAVSRGHKLTDQLDNITASGLIRLVNPHTGSYEFRHHLIYQAVHDLIPDARRLALHRDVADAVRMAHPADAWLHAEHLASSGPLAGPDAPEVFSRASHSLSRRFSHDAAERFARLAVLHHEQQHGGQVRLCELLLDHAQALQRLGRLDEANATYVRAWELADEAASVALAARSVMGLLPWRHMIRTPLQARAAQAVPALVIELSETDPDLAIALGAAATELRQAGLGRGAVEVARLRVGNERRSGTLQPASLIDLARVLDDVAEIDERSAVTAEAMELARTVGDPAAELAACQADLDSGALLGDLVRVEEAVSRAETLAQRMRRPDLAFRVEGLRSAVRLLRGDVKGVQAAIAVMQARMDREHDDARTLLANLIITVTHETGEWETAEADIAAWQADIGVPDEPLLRYSQAVAHITTAHHYAMAGDLEAAGEHYWRYVDIDYHAVRDPTWLIGCGVLAYLAWRLDDPRSAARVYELALPYRRLWTWSGLATLGPVERCLGLAAAAMGRSDLAEGHLSKAIGVCARAGSPLNEARVTLELVEILAGASTNGGHARIGSLLRRAAKIAETHGSATSAQVAARLATRFGVAL